MQKAPLSDVPVAFAVEMVRKHNWLLDACVGYARVHILFRDDERQRNTKHSTMTLHIRTYHGEQSINERHSCLLRRFIPKRGVSMEKFSPEQILAFADELNGRPRKRLSYTRRQRNCLKHFSIASMLPELLLPFYWSVQLTIAICVSFIPVTRIYKKARKKAVRLREPPDVGATYLSGPSPAKYCEQKRA